MHRHLSLLDGEAVIDETSPPLLDVMKAAHKEWFHSIGIIYVRILQSKLPCIVTLTHGRGNNGVHKKGVLLM